jgi:hypothetical protein
MNFVFDSVRFCVFFEWTNCYLNNHWPSSTISVPLRTDSQTGEADHKQTMTGKAGP